MIHDLGGARVARGLSLDLVVHADFPQHALDVLAAGRAVEDHRLGVEQRSLYRLNARDVRQRRSWPHCDALADAAQHDTLGFHPARLGKRVHYRKRHYKYVELL
jgi:hypothetical protein